jgi:hypothetical protein
MAIIYSWKRNFHHNIIKIKCDFKSWFCIELWKKCVTLKLFNLKSVVILQFWNEFGLSAIRLTNRHEMIRTLKLDMWRSIWSIPTAWRSVQSMSSCANIWSNNISKTSDKGISLKKFRFQAKTFHVLHYSAQALELSKHKISLFGFMKTYILLGINCLYNFEGEESVFRISYSSIRIGFQYFFTELLFSWNRAQK